MQVFSGHSDVVTAGTFTSDGKNVITVGGDQDRSLRVWNPKTGECTVHIEGHPFHDAGESLSETRVHQLHLLYCLFQSCPYGKSLAYERLPQFVLPQVLSSNRLILMILQSLLAFLFFKYTSMSQGVRFYFSQVDKHIEGCAYACIT